VTASRSSGGVATGFASRQQKTHGTNSELKILRYPWHPWWGKNVLTSKAHGNQAESSYFCALPEARDAPLVAIPRWMFDAVTCGAMDMVASPFVDLGPLRDLKRVLRDQRAGWRASVIQLQPSEQLNSGEADGNSRSSIAHQAVGVIHRAAADTSLGGSDSPSASASSAPSRAPSGTGPRSRPRRQPSKPRRRSSHSISHAKLFCTCDSLPRTRS
jgi:hypothetical protein